MTQIKFIHTSDLHVGFAANGRLNPITKLNTRLEDVMRSLDFLVETAIEEDVRLVLISGDVFHRSNPTPAEQTEFALRMERLTGAGIEVVIITGNHDFTLDGSGVSALEVIPALKHPRLTVVRLPVTLNRCGAQIACLPWIGGARLIARDEFKDLSPVARRAEIERRLAAIVRGLAENATLEAGPTVLMGHFAVAGSVAAGTEYTSLADTEPQIPLSALADSRFAYVALGHIHRPQDLHGGINPPVVYAGSIERVDFTEEGQKKGFVLGELFRGENRWTCRYRYVETPARRFITVDLGADGMPPEPPGDEIEGAIVRLRFNIETADQSLDEPELRKMYDRAFSVKIEKNYAYKDNKRVVRAEGILKGITPASALGPYIEQHPELEPLRADMEARVSDILGQKEAA
jgi:exonuclease SbcD